MDGDMKLSQQLRIGNLIYRGDEVITVTHLTISSVVDLEYLDLQDIFIPIPITPEWLERAGFKYRNEHRGEAALMDHYTGDKNDMCVGINFVNKGSGFVLLTFRSAPIYFVHDIQNCYFAMYGQELEIKL